MASSRSWPFDDDDRPSGSVRPLSQADLQAILAHLGDDPNELLAGTDDRPVVAVGAGQRGPAGRLRPGDLAAAAGGRVGHLDPDPALAGRRHPRDRCRWGSPWQPAGAPAGAAAGRAVAVAVGWGLRFRPSPDAVAWRRGAAGERRTARLLAPLERHGWAILHDLAVPGSRANLDHLVIGPGGVFVIDSKQYRGRLQLDRSGRLWHGRYPLAPALRAV